MQIVATGETLIETIENVPVEGQHEPGLYPEHQERVHGVKNHASDKRPLQTFAGIESKEYKQPGSPQVDAKPYHLRNGATHLHGYSGGKHGYAQAAKKRPIRLGNKQDRINEGKSAIQKNHLAPASNVASVAFCAAVVTLGSGSGCGLDDKPSDPIALLPNLFSV